MENVWTPNLRQREKERLRDNGGGRIGNKRMTTFPSLAPEHSIFQYREREISASPIRAFVYLHRPFLLSLADAFICQTDLLHPLE